MSDKDSGSGGSEKHRRRRMNKPPSGRSSHSPKTPRSAIVPIPPISKFVPSPKDLESIVFLSSPFRVWQVISSFDSRKRSIVKSIGFGGLLSMPCITYDNKSFSLWLLNRLHWFTCCININDSLGLNLRAEHIGKISGLTYVGTDVSDDSLETVDEKLAFINANLAFLGSGSSIVDSAETFVQHEFPTFPSKKYCDNFKIAFVIFVMGRFLAPSSEHPDGNSNFWGALENPDEIQSYNWSAYVLENIREAARFVNWVIPASNKLSSVIGCPLIVQIFYLDNLELGALNLCHELLPRWQYFSDECLQAMVKADTAIHAVGSSNTDFGFVQAVREGSSCYGSVKGRGVISSPSVSTPSPALCPRFPKSSSRTVFSTLGALGHCKIDSSLPSSSICKSTLASDLLDFSAIIKSKYQGQVDSVLFQELERHNERCLEHIHQSYLSLAVSIVKENADIAMKLLERSFSPSGSTIEETVSENYLSKRRTYKDFLTGTDSSTEGEDNSKIARNKNHGSTSLVGNLPTNALGGISNYQNDQSILRSCMNKQKQSLTDHNVHIHSTTPNSPAIHKIHGPMDSFLTKTPPINIDEHNALQKPTLVLSPSHLGIHSDVQDRRSHLSSSTAELSPNVIGKSVTLMTPEATLKMSSFSPKFSISSEHKSFPVASIGPNACKYDESEGSAGFPKKQAHPGQISPSHWSLQLDYPAVDPCIANSYVEWLRTTSAADLGRCWINCNTPPAINISGYDLKDQFFSIKPFSVHLMDVCIRRVKHLDNILYHRQLPLRWRHLIETDYAMHVFAAEDPTHSNSIRDQFVGPAIDYELSRCRMFFVPVVVDGKWMCYAWDLKYCQLYIIDPSCNGHRDDYVIKKHSGFIEQLACSLTSMVTDLFTGWSPNFTTSNCNVVHIPQMSCSSGIITLFCIWNFDGNKLAVNCTESNLEHFKAYLLYNLLDKQGITL